MVGATCLTNGRLQDATTLQLDSAAGLANRALEEGLRHLRNQIGQSDDHASHGDQLIDIGWVEAPHAGDLVAVVRTHSNVHVVVGKLGEVEFLDAGVKGLHDFDWVADELFVQLRVEVLQVNAVEVEEGVLNQMHLREHRVRIVFGFRRKSFEFIV